MPVPLILLVVLAVVGLVGTGFLAGLAAAVRPASTVAGPVLAVVLTLLLVRALATRSGKGRP